MKKKLIITLLILLFISTVLYNRYFISHKIKVVEYGIIDKNIPDNFHGLKIVQYSDILYGKSATIKDINNVVKKINELNPDIVIFTGDLFTKDIKVNTKEIEKIKKALSNIKAKYKKFAILGDNDKVFKDSFYQVFSDDYEILDNEESLFYLNDETPIRFVGISNVKKEEVINDEENKLYNILLIHKPDEVDNLKNKYNLIFSGHSMGGQIKFPFYGPLIKIKGAKKYTSGEYEVNNAKLYVNDGIGSQNITMRINNHPKINLYRLYSK
jgi:hypothetical protein